MSHIGRDAFSGVTSYSRPTPPPPMPSEPPTPPPPSPSFDGCVTDLADTCHAYFRVESNGEYTPLCAGTPAEIQDKIANKLCAADVESTGTDLCSDGGYGAWPVSWTAGTFESDAVAVFGCNYGSQVFLNLVKLSQIPTPATHLTHHCVPFVCTVFGVRAAEAI